VGRPLGSKNKNLAQPFSDERKRKISLAKLGKPQPWNSRPMSEEQKLKLRIAHLGTSKPWNSHPHTQEQNLKQSLALKGKRSWNKGQTGLQTAWNKGTGSPDSRNTLKYYNYCEMVRTRDNHICLHCGLNKEQVATRDGSKILELDCHHIQPWDEFPELRYDLDNGLTLCKRCHKREEDRLKHLKS
jgi:hypothetical protein